MMHIALTIDSKFVRYCAVTIVSILENNDPKDILLYLPDLTESLHLLVPSLFFIPYYIWGFKRHPHVY